jgi:hypothetical protein
MEGRAVVRADQTGTGGILLDPAGMVWWYAAVGSAGQRSPVRYGRQPPTTAIGDHQTREATHRLPGSVGPRLTFTVPGATRR